MVTHVTLTHTSQVRPLPGQPCSRDGNGRRSGLKIRCLRRRAGSSPVGSTMSLKSRYKNSYRTSKTLLTQYDKEFVKFVEITDGV